MELLRVIAEKKVRTIGIEGNSGAGKTTFAKKLASALGAQIILMDYFIKKQRKQWNLQTDINDFADRKKAQNVIEKLLNGERFAMDDLYNHSDGTLSKTVQFEPTNVLVIEGLGVMRLQLDMKIFLNVDPAVALIRGKERDIRERNLTEEQWIIKKHLFHDAYSKLIPEFKAMADIVIDTTNQFPEVT